MLVLIGQIETDLPLDSVVAYVLMLKSRLNFPTETLAIIVTGVRCSLEHALYIKSSDLDIYLTILAKVDKF